MKKKTDRDGNLSLFIHRDEGLKRNIGKIAGEKNFTEDHPPKNNDCCPHQFIQLMKEL